MNNPTESYRPQEDEDPRLFAAARDYLAALEAGRRPTRPEFLARFPELADALPSYLDAIDMVHAGGRILPASGNRPVVEETLPAEPLGDFRLVREIGRGGMGVVYEAVQLSLGRRVALKVLPFAAALDAKQLQRFRNEAQAAAQLHHTNIVPVYAVGTERGVHYYAMQLIEGQNLGDLIAQLRPGEPSRGPRTQASASGVIRKGRLAPEVPSPASVTVSEVAAELSTQRASRSGSFYRTAARLAIQAADALEHAHQLGVIHRDIKPANLMIDGRGTLWVADFGLAQFHTTVGLTRTGDMLGTLRYMSPEQAGGQNVLVDPRTDVYSLGATLYELITLQPMLGGTDHHQLLRQILEEEPRPPRAVMPTIPPELETIVLKAVSKNPAERYASAQEFGDDLRRFLDNVPIHARRPTVVQRARKWGRRHPSIVVAGFVLLLLLTAGSMVTAALVRTEQEKTKLALEGEIDRANLAEKRLELARRSVDDLVQVSETWLADMPHLTGLRRELLTKALVAYDKFIDEKKDDPNAQRELGEIKERVAAIVKDLAALEGASKLPVLSNQSVQDDLRLGDDQRARVKQLIERMDRKRKDTFTEFIRMKDEERRQAFVRDAHAVDDELNAILNDRQTRRLRQIALQLEGPAAFREPEVITRLELTADQRSRIHGIEASTFSPMDGKHPPGPGGRRGPEFGIPLPRPDRVQKSEKARAQILALLTAEQNRRWQELTGEPFTGSTANLFSLPPGPCEPPPQ